MNFEIWGLIIIAWVILGGLSLYDMYLSSINDPENEFSSREEGRWISSHVIMIIIGMIGGIFWVFIWFILKDDFKK